jgi:AcrR family transcriptional regulator
VQNVNEEKTEPVTQLPRPARKRNPEESRRRILDAAERAFALRGFGGARLRDIAQEAGVHHALVHHYYGDKRGLLEEVIKRGLARIAEAARHALAAPVSLEGTVRAFVGVLFDFCASNRGLLRIIDDAFRNRELVSFDVIQQALGAHAGPVVQRIKQTIEQGQKTGQVRTDLSAESLILLGFGAIVYRFDMAENLLAAMGLPSREEPDLDREREHAIAYILSAMQPSSLATTQ